MLHHENEGAYGPRTLRALGRAYQIALNELRSSSKSVPSPVQEEIAKNIIDQASGGERNPLRLAMHALRSIGKRK